MTNRQTRQYHGQTHSSAEHDFMINNKQPFSHFINQPLLMKHYLSAFNSQIEDYANNEKDIIDHAILLWNLIHHTILEYRKSNPGWLFIKHETLSADPIAGFETIYKSLNLPYTDAIQNRIKTFSYVKDKSLEDKLHRNSQANIFIWKQRLTADEIIRIKAGTDEIAKQFYTDADW